MIQGMTAQLTPKIVERLINLIGTRVAIPVSPLPGEGLADLLYRAAFLNGYPNVAKLMGKGQGIYSHFLFTRPGVDLDAVSDRLGTPNGASDLTPLVYSRVGGSRINFFGATLNARQMIGGRRLSPLSLRASNHSKAIWHVRTLCFDPETNERLMSQCPVCATPFDFRYSVALHRCRRCGPLVDLREFPQPIEDCTDPEALRILTGLIDPERLDGKRALSALHPDLANENPGDIFTFCTVLAVLANPRADQRSSILRAEPSASNLARATRAVLQWPRGVLDMASEIERNFSAKSTVAFARGAVVTGCISCRLSPSIVHLGQKLFTRHRLDKHAVKGSEEGYSLQQPITELIETFEVARRSLDYQRACLATGLTPLAFFGCYLSKFFGSSDNRDNLLGADFARFVDSLKFEMLPVRETDEDTMPLKNLVRAAGRYSGDPWPMVIKALGERMLPVFREAASTDINGLHVSEIGAWVDFLSQISGVEPIDALRVRARDAALYFNRCEGNLRLAIGFDRTVTFGDVQRLDRTYTTVQELSDRMRLRHQHVPIRQVINMLNKANIRAERTMWRDRASAERLFELCDS